MKLKKYYCPNCKRFRSGRETEYFATTCEAYSFSNGNQTIPFEQTICMYCGKEVYPTDDLMAQVFSDYIERSEIEHKVGFHMAKR